MSLTTVIRSTSDFLNRPVVFGSSAPRKAVVASEGKSRRYQMLDVWRGVICLLVVLEHVGVGLWEGSDQGTGLEGMVRQAIVWVLQLNIGTPLFFVISGYCIASSIESSRRKGHSPAMFLARRFWRIFPTYWAALLGFVVLVAGIEACGLTRFRQHCYGLELFSPLTLTVGQWIGNITLTETWRPLVGGAYSNVITRVAWSLCFQEQFYMVCCLILWLMPGRMSRGLAVVTCMIAIYRAFLWDSGGLPRINGTFLYAWHEFAVGLAVYWRLNAGASAQAWARRSVEAAIAALAMVGLATHYRSTAAAGLFGLLLIALYRWDETAGRLTWLEPLRASGRRSFSIYLTHLPIAVIGNGLLVEMGLEAFWTRVFVMVPVVTVASVAVGWLFHHAVERHFLGAPPSLEFLAGLQPRTRPRPAVAVATVVVKAA